MRSLVAVAGGLLFGAAVQWGCSCPPGKEMVSTQAGTYLVEEATAEPDYRLEVSQDRAEIVERFTQNGKTYEIRYQTERFRGDGGI